ncbi:hypothetical protein [Streptomyces sp. CC224B]|uniref:hypothetical protein n=1 Tax=Streptomyces sp. CC224B TaxID=3044571 RepID=UPI0024A95DD7|nr:hypothetical protein [Streptomyces sp. CC224B]
MARLAATVYVRDPGTHQWVTCDAGSEPAPHLAALILTASAWQDGTPPPPAAPTHPASAAEAADAAEPEDDDGADAADPPEKKPRTRRSAAKTDG